MSPTTTQSVSQALAFDGVIPVWAVFLIGLLLGGIVLWLGKRDYGFTRKAFWISVLTALRLTAIAALLWMIAGPTSVTSQFSQTTESLAVLVDHSASMKLVDPVDESGNNLRWLAARSDQSTLLKQIDTAAGDLGAVAATLGRLTAQDSGIEKDVQEVLEKAAETLRGTSDSLDTTVASLPRPLSEHTSPLREFIMQLSAPLKLLESKSYQDLSGNIRFDQVKSISLQCAAAARVFIRLADRMAETLEATGTSNSQDALERTSVESRIDKANDVLASAQEGWLGDLEKKAAVSYYHFGKQVLPISNRIDKTAESQEFSETTDLSSALRQIALDGVDQDLQAAILITDGGHNDGDDPATLAGNIGNTPLFVVPIGNTKIPRDVILHHTLAPRAVYENDLVVVDTMVSAYRCLAEELRVELMANGTLVDQKTLNVSREIFDSRVQLKFRARELGRHELSVRAVPLAGEKSEQNNQSELTVNVMEDKIRVLIADNFPRWEFRYLVNLFERDERIEYEQLIFEPRHRSSGRVPPPPTFPFDYEDWMRYRIIILGDLRPAQLSAAHQELLHRYVTEYGGNLIVIAGKESMPQAFVGQPLEGLLPVEHGTRPLNRSVPYGLSVTPEGSFALPIQLQDTTVASESLWREMSRRLPIYSLSDYSQLKPTGHSLLAAENLQSGASRLQENIRSFLAWHYVGRGRVVYLAAPISYQLRYLQGDRHHHRFWGQLLRWAVARDLAEGSRTVRLATDKTRYEQGDPVRITASLYRLDGSIVSGANPTVSATQDDRLIQSLPLTENPGRPGSYEGTLTGVPTGQITLKLSGDPIPSLLAAERYDGPIESVINVDPSGQQELRHPLCNLALLNQIAKAGNGFLIPPAGLESAVTQLDFEPKTTELVQRKPIWNQWKYLWIFVVCLSLEWIGRKLIGLI